MASYFKNRNPQDSFTIAAELWQALKEEMGLDTLFPICEILDKIGNWGFYSIASGTLTCLMT